MRHDAVGQPAAADQAEHPVADLPAEHSRSGGDHLPGDLQPRDVRGRAGRRRVVALPLGHVGPVDAREAGGHEDLVGPWNRVRALLQPDDLVAPVPGEYDRSHGSKPSHSAWWSSHHVAMSSRRMNRTSGRDCTYSTKSRMAVARLACPLQRSCSPTVIILAP